MTNDFSKLLDAMATLGSRVTCHSSPPPNFAQINEEYAKLELEPGSAILLLAGNNLEFIYHWVAIVANQYVPAPASPSLKSARVKDLQRSLGLSAIVCSRASSSLFEGEQTRTIGSLQLIKFADAYPAYSEGEALILTSGTSGLHTACVHKVESLIENAKMHNEALGITSSDRQLMILPMYYSFAMVAQTIGSILAGCHLIIEGPPFTAARYAKKIEQCAISVSAITPTLVREILHSGVEITSLRVLSVGGDQLKDSDVAKLLAKPYINELYLTYGLTEAGPRVATLAAHRSSVALHNSVGPTLPGIESVINDPDQNGVGELYIRTPTALVRKVGEGALPVIGHHGYLETGDLFTKDEDGNLRYVGRKRDFVLINGEKVNTKSISQLAEKHPAIKFAKTSVSEDGSLHLEISVRTDQDIEDSEFGSFLSQRLQRFEIPSKIVKIEANEFQK